METAGIEPAYNPAALTLLRAWNGRRTSSSGFGVQNRLVAARQEHAGYCARYISTRLAPVAPLRRAFGFSADFPKVSPATVSAELAKRFGVEPDPCEWQPRHELL